MTTNEPILTELPQIGPAGWDEVWDTIEGPHGVRYFSRSGRPISMRDWCRIKAWDDETNDRDYTRVAADDVGPYLISTVWLGLDHGFGGPPLIFETMVFRTDLPDRRPPWEEKEYEFDEDEEPEFTRWTDLDMARYGSEGEALAGHAAMVEKVRLIVDASSP